MQICFRLVFCFLLLCAGSAQAQIHDGKQLVMPSLIADTTAIVPGKPFTVGLLLKMQPDWHTYWKYAGDSGLPTKLDWKLPGGFTASAIEWPLPEKIIYPGDLQNYGYNGETLLLVTIMPPPKLAVSEVTLAAHASWLVCSSEQCIPGVADVALKLPVAKNADDAKPANGDLFEKYRAQIPQPFEKLPSKLTWSRVKGGLQLVISETHGEPLDFFPLPPDSLTLGHPKIVKNDADSTTIFIPIDSMPANLKSLHGLIVSGSGVNRTSWFTFAHLTNREMGVSGATPFSWRALLRNLLLGFIGGMILNVMPCVLPVIGLKIMGFVQQAGSEPRKVFRLGLAFVAGIFAWFLALAALIIVFKAAGHQVNWAFQFQNKWFVCAMFLIVLIFALNLFGLFEILLPHRANSRLMTAVSHEGYPGAFLHGVFATLLATPCTAPFLGTALGYAFSQPPLRIIAVFAAIAAGMSLPYFLLTAKPAWLKLLPRPGIWMVRVKQFMGVLLLGTALWLGWVFYQQMKPRPHFAPQLAAALKQDRTVFVDFTADWCANCKVYERFVLDSDAVEKAFANHQVLLVKADWTAGDPDITALLKHFQRAGVPLYVIYPKGAHDHPIVLPEALTKKIVLDALNKSTASAD